MLLGLPTLLSIQPALYLAVRLSHYQTSSSSTWSLFEREVRSANTTLKHLLTRTIHSVTVCSRVRTGIFSVELGRQELPHRIQKALHTSHSQIQCLGKGLLVILIRLALFLID